MKAVQIARYGDTPALQDIEQPSPGPGEVLVRVAGAATNPLDLKITAGYMHDFFPVEFPYTLGTDVSGTITTLGDRVERWAIGDQIVARLDPSAGGGYAEFAVIPAEQLVPAPTSIPLFLAAGAVTAAATAWQALTEIADVHAGQTVLIHAAAGGVGSFAVQMAHTLDAHVITTASGAGLQIARDLGADEVIDHTSGLFQAQLADADVKVDVVIDTVGGAVEEQSLDVLRPGGLLVAVPTPPDTERASARGLRAEFLFHASDPQRLATVIKMLDGDIQVLLDQTLDLDQAPQALQYLSAGHAKGKIILTPTTPEPGSAPGRHAIETAYADIGEYRRTQG
ncbi:NADP-dependent oxidoreductase [Jatrophihabitans lederbergiae]|uniref:NADP-dependent oxidoreductase n=1 Tax=Jatrophihabitans lederbergiae TaxID=3075547 RepID=A0ABU2JGN4_9ACTN|nr:NADP-dependent oxidoreductase [Jatrophihabitans sp. DSM 44399]MDT0264150.1 NADP-dependent oxidoreductase [Jatrophihabitans sp. DSM 44399]